MCRCLRASPNKYFKPEITAYGRNSSRSRKIKLQFRCLTWLSRCAHRRYILTLCSL